MPHLVAQIAYDVALHIINTTLFATPYRWVIALHMRMVRCCVCMFLSTHGVASTGDGSGMVINRQ